MISINKELLNSSYHIVANLDGLPFIGDASQQAKVTARRELQSPSLRYGDCLCFARRSQSALMASILDKVFNGEL